MLVLKWYLTVVRNETLEKKPFNPVIGETHMCWVDNGQSDYSEYISEQVSHHPPVSAWVVRNRNRKYTLSSNTSFGVKFGRNYVAVTTSGAVNLTTPLDTYEANKLPDLKINNVIKGKKYIMWEGEVTISCPESGYINYFHGHRERRSDPVH